MTERVRRPIEVRLPDFGVAVIESHHEDDFRSSLLRHSFAKFILVIGGRGQFKVNERCIPLEPDVLLHVAPAVAHSIEDEAGNPLSLYAACYRLRADIELLANALAQRPVQSWSIAGRAAAFRSDFREMLFEQSGKRTGWQVVMQSRVGDLLARACRMSEYMAASPAVNFPKGKDSAESVAAYGLMIESRFYRNESLDEAALSTGLSRRRFTELFRQLTGQSWHERIRELRLGHARKMLTQTDKSVIGVAFECGFDDVAHFHRVFKHAVGTSPLAYRKNVSSKFRVRNESS